ncbi:MAG: hypothetical protein ACLPPF_04595 [Rhodomicrobium sp.]
MMVRHRPAPASRAKVSSSASKDGFDTPLEIYQKLSAVAGETKAVMTRCDGPLTDGRPDAPRDGLQTGPVLAAGKGFDPAGRDVWRPLPP